MKRHSPAASLIRASIVLLIAASSGPEKALIHSENLASLAADTVLTQAAPATRQVPSTGVASQPVEVTVVNRSVVRGQTEVELRTSYGQTIRTTERRFQSLRVTATGQKDTRVPLCRQPPTLLPLTPAAAPVGAPQTSLPAVRDNRPIAEAKLEPIAEVAKKATQVAEVPAPAAPAAPATSARASSPAPAASPGPSYFYGTYGGRYRAPASDPVAEARGREIVERARDLSTRYSRHAENDQQVLSRAFTELPPAERRKGLLRASESLALKASALEKAPLKDSGMLPGDRTRFVNQLRNASDLARIRATEPERVAPNPAAHSNDSLVERQMMLEALPPKDRQRIQSQLKLVESPRLGAASTRDPIPLVHNGYWLGGAKSGTDCSGFVSQVLPEEVRNLRVTTLDLVTLDELVRTGDYLPPPVYTEDRLGKLKKMAGHMDAVYLEQGEPLRQGDLLVYRILDEPIGHVFVVESYDPTLLSAKVYEASQSFGGMRKRDFDLSVVPYDESPRYLRPGLFGLRVKPVSKKAGATKKAGVK